RILSISRPTLPVAPAIAILKLILNILSLSAFLTTFNVASSPTTGESAADERCYVVFVVLIAVLAIEFAYANCAADWFTPAAFIKLKFCNSLKTITIPIWFYRGG
ncbi:MAG: hypothetical protein ABJL73_07990, partial [Lentilitoribacter sp.]